MIKNVKEIGLGVEKDNVKKKGRGRGKGKEKGKGKKGIGRENAIDITEVQMTDTKVIKDGVQEIGNISH